MRVLVTSISDADWLCSALVKQPGFELAAFHPTYVQLGDWGVSRTDATQPREYQVCASRVFPTRPYPASVYLQLGRLAALLHSFRPDVIYHLGEPSELGSWQLLRLARRVCPKVPIVLFSLENVVRQWRGFPRCLRGWAESATMPLIDMVAAASDSVAKTWERQGFDPARIRVNYLPIDTNKFYPREAADLRAQWASPEQFVVGYIGRFVPEKGVDLLLRAMARLPERFVLALEGHGLCEAQLRALAEELRLGDKVKWLGRAPSEQVPRYMSAYDALVLPSRGIPVWQEQYGRVVPEAMLCGTAVVGAASGAIPEVIGDAGLVFPENDYEALAECLLRLGTDEALQQQCVERGLERAQQEFTMETTVRRAVAMLREAVALGR
jgi:glycosyltransferase involved in cell wall biosynthesis